MANTAKTKPKESSPFITLSSRETVGWSAALFLLFGWLFFLGVLVGRGSIEVELIPTEVQRELAVIPDKQAIPQPDKGAPAATPATPPVELSFYKEVKQSEEAITKSSRMTKAEKEVLRPGQAPRPAEPQVATARPAAPKVTKPAPKAAVPAPTSGFTIQVAAHIKEASAESEVKALQSKGFPAYWVAAENSKGQTWYRVRVGRFTQRDAAKQELARLAPLKSKAYVVKL